MQHDERIENVPLQRFRELTGITQKAVYGKIARGVWLQGYEFDRSPTGAITIYLPGYHRWARGLPRVLRDDGDGGKRKKLTSGQSEPVVSAFETHNFKALDSVERTRIASLGGHALQKSGKAHKFDTESARSAGRKGGLARKR